jgi:uncharacterized protein (TIGR01777 family)
MKVIVAGGTGFIGHALSGSLVRNGHEVVVLTRDPSPATGRLPTGVRAVAWGARDPAGAWVVELRGAGAVVNLAGASIGGGRWTEQRKHLLTRSRVDSTEALVRAMEALSAAEGPQALVTASGIDYYGHHPGDEALDESAPPGSSFLARLCVEWEDAALNAEALGIRVVRVRTALCVGRGAEALDRLVLPFRLFAGGPLGNGRQWFTWIHLEDLVGLYMLAIERSDLAGPVNAVAPHVPRERDMAREIGRVLHRPAWAPAPAFALRLVLGEMADLVLHGRNAVPARAVAARYQFRYPEVGPALREALTSAQ